MRFEQEQDKIKHPENQAENKVSKYVLTTAPFKLACTAPQIRSTICDHL